MLVAFPGRSAAQVEQLVAGPLERLLSQIDGVEYVYSRSLPGQAIVSARFYVGQDRECSLVKLRKWIDQNLDKIPPGVTGWVVKPIETDDVPILTLTFTSPTAIPYQLRRVAEETLDRLQGVKNVGLTSIVGGEPRQMLVRLQPERFAGYHLTPLEIDAAFKPATSTSRSARTRSRTKKSVSRADGFCAPGAIWKRWWLA